MANPNENGSQPMSLGQLLTVHEVAQRYGVSDECVRLWIRKGLIGYVMVGPFRLKRIPLAEAERHFKWAPGAKI